MNKTFVILEQWRKGGYSNRLVTNGKTIRLEYRNMYTGLWKVDRTPESTQTYFLKVFK